MVFFLKFDWVFLRPLATNIKDCSFHRELNINCILQYNQISLNLFQECATFTAIYDEWQTHY